MEIYDKKIKKWPGFTKNLYAKALLNSFPRYQPIWWNGKLVVGSDRDCFDRWKLIENEIKKDNVRTLVDLGSAEGFYVIQAAKECGVLSLGVDADERRISLAQMQIVNEKIENAGSIYATINKEFIQKMPVFDCIIFMSVAHHMMASVGKEETFSLLSEIRKKTGKFCVFEMGQSDEIGMAWAEKLPKMKPSPHNWISDFLKEAGFSAVVKVGESLSYNGNVRRAIFKASI